MGMVQLDVIQRGKNISSKRLRTMFRLIDEVDALDDMDHRNFAKISRTSRPHVGYQDGLVATLDEDQYQETIITSV